MTTGPLVDPATIEGTVYSKHMSDGMPSSFAGRVVAASSRPFTDYLVEWDVSLHDGDGQEHHLYCFAPKALPIAVRAGDAVRIRTLGRGGGPNIRYSIEIRSDGGELLLAVNQPPSDWVVKQGKAGGKTPMNGYDQTSYGVTFEHEGQRVDVPSASWARLTVGPRTYYLWGSGAERTLHPGKRPMPDYVGGWLDFAIVLAR